MAAESWAAVILPSSGETAAYFRGSQARPDNGALVPNASPEADEVRSALRFRPGMLLSGLAQHQVVVHEP